MSQNTCNHQLVFTASLDHAASCARCGAIALIEQKNGRTQITWINAMPPPKQSNSANHISTGD